MEYRFGSVVVNTERLDVRLDGERRPTEPQVIAVLLHLIEQRHRVVTKEELLDAVWGTQFVSASAVTSRIKSARQAIGDTGREQGMIRTVHGRGYRFVADLDPDHGDGHRDDVVDDHRGDGGDHNGDHDGDHNGDDGEPSTVQPAAGDRTPDAGWPLMGRERERAQATALALDGTRGGLLFTGPAGLGKTRLARAVIEALAAEGIQVARIHGHPGAASVPLAALAHLLPTDLVDVRSAQGEMAKTILLQRAREAIRERAGDDRLALMVDDVDRVDSLSQALLGSLIADGSVFAIMTQRITHAEPIAMEHLVRDGTVEQVTLGGIPDDQMIALIGRVLDGPVQPTTSEALVSASGGVPGVLRQLIEAGLSNGSLSMRNDVWRLSGGVTPPGDMAAAVRRRLADLDDEQCDALELLAVAGDLRLDVAFDLIGDEVLDQLELDGMVSVREVGRSTHLRLSHPLFVEILLDAITPLRDRRIRGRLVDALARQESTSAAERLQLVRLQLDSGVAIDTELLLESAALALIEGDTGLALQLLRSVPADRQTVRYQQLFGEVLYMRGRFAEAIEVWRAIELDRLDDETAAAVIRRITTWLFYGSGRYAEALAYVDEQLPRFEGSPRDWLESYRAEIGAIDGNDCDAVIERATSRLEGAEGHARADLLSGLAMAHFVRGRHERALALIDERRTLAAGLEPTVYFNASDYSDFVEVMAHVEWGDLVSAWATFDRVTEPGAAPDLGFASIAAGRLALAAGRWHQVLDWLQPKIEITEALGITTYGRPLQATAAVAAVMAGDHDTARRMQTALRSDLADAVNITTLDLRWSIERVEASIGDRDAGVAGLLRAAADARAADMHYMECLLLGSAVHVGGAAGAVERLGALTDVVDGPLIGLRHRAARAVLGEADGGAVLDELDARGLVFEASSLRDRLALDGR